MTKDIKWFLMKDEWRDIFQDLTPEQVGLLTMKLYNMDVELPGLLNTIYKAMKSEFMEVNNSVQERRQKKSEKAKKAAEARWSKETDMPKHADASVSNAKEHVSNALKGKEKKGKERKLKEIKEIKEIKVKEPKVNNKEGPERVDYAQRAREVFQ